MGTDEADGDTAPGDIFSPLIIVEDDLKPDARFTPAVKDLLRQSI